MFEIEIKHKKVLVKLLTLQIKVDEFINKFDKVIETEKNPKLREQKFCKIVEDLEENLNKSRYD